MDVEVHQARITHGFWIAGWIDSGIDEWHLAFLHLTVGIGIGNGMLVVLVLALGLAFAAVHVYSHRDGVKLEVMAQGRCFAK